MRVIAHEHVRVLMAGGHVDDSLLASLGSGVSFAVWIEAVVIDLC